MWPTDHGSNGIDERAVVQEVDFGEDDHQGQEHYYMRGTLDTVIALVGERGNIEEGYGYDAYGLMKGFNFIPGDFNADGVANLVDFATFASNFTG